MINESRCYPNILSVYHNYIIGSQVGLKVILRVGEVAMSGLGVGILSHQNICRQETDGESNSMLKPRFYFLF